VKAGDIQQVILVGGMTRMPAVKQAVIDLFGKEPHQGVNPDEVVAVGASIQAGVLQGEVQDLLLLDVTPLTLGIETLGGVKTDLIPRNTTIPTAKTETFTTAADGQTSVEVHVLQGERPMAAENKTIGKFMLDGILSAPRGTPQVDVTFDINADGILDVSAKDQATGKEQRITITASSGLTEDEIDGMVKEAEAHAEEDARRREDVETRNNAENAIYGAEKLLSDNDEKVPEDLKTEIQGKIEVVRTALEGEDSAQIKSALQSLQETVQQAGQLLYSQSDEAGDGSSAVDNDSEDQSQSNDDDTVEGEYREV